MPFLFYLSFSFFFPFPFFLFLPLPLSLPTAHILHFYRPWFEGAQVTNGREQLICEHRASGLD